MQSFRHENQTILSYEIIRLCSSMLSGDSNTSVVYLLSPEQESVERLHRVGLRAVIVRKPENALQKI